MTLFDDPPAVPVTAAPPLSEEDIAAGVLDYLADEYADVLTWLRGELVRVYRFRVADVGEENAFVSADDARAQLPRCPFAVPTCLNMMGSLFRAPGWRPMGGYHRSNTPGSHGKRLLRWRWEGD